MFKSIIKVLKYLKNSAQLAIKWPSYGQKRMPTYGLEGQFWPVTLAHIELPITENK